MSAADLWPKDESSLYVTEGPPQITIDGHEVSTEHANQTSSARSKPMLTEAQRVILRAIEVQGFIRTTEAGVIVHECRGSCGTGARTMRHQKAGTHSPVACCPYAAADGLSAMHRLAKRSLVEKDLSGPAGRWKAKVANLETVRESRVESE